MARPSLRDRFFTPETARAIVSPTTLIALLAGAVLGYVAAGVAGAVLLGAAAVVARVALAIPRRRPVERIDPFTLSEPWRHYVRDAVQAQRRFGDAVRGAREGPTRARLQEIDARVATGVQEVWRIARRGDDLVDARRRADPESIRRRLAAATAGELGRGDASSAAEPLVESLQAQLATVERLDQVIADADSRLQLLSARLDEAAVRTIELSVGAGEPSELLGLGSAVDAVVEEMEALRQAIEETGGGSAVAGAG